jgi:hypothetical protein
MSELGAGAAQEILDLHVQGAAGHEFDAILKPEAHELIFLGFKGHQVFAFLGRFCHRFTTGN